MKRPPVNILAAFDAMKARADYFERKCEELQREYDRLADRLMTRGTPQGKWEAEQYDAAAELQVLEQEPMDVIEARRAVCVSYSRKGQVA